MIGLKNQPELLVLEKSRTSRKEHIVQELKEYLSIVLYLGSSFSLLATFKSLILIQLGINNFIHGYVVSLVESLALGEIVLHARKLPVLNTFDKSKALAWSALFKATIMALVVLLLGETEDRFFLRFVARVAIKREPIVVLIHLLALFVIFYILFVVQELNRALGPGKLFNLFISPASPSIIDGEKTPAAVDQPVQMSR